MGRCIVAPLGHYWAIEDNYLLLILAQYNEDSYEYEKNLLKEANADNLAAMELYCRQELISSYTSDIASEGICQDASAEEVLPFLIAGAYAGNANMIFMYACVISGCQVIEDSHTGRRMNVPDDYTYFNRLLAKRVL